MYRDDIVNMKKYRDFSVYKNIYIFFTGLKIGIF